ncbi:hypothetical protein QAD02_010527 [Eretmocerus hayati]|uniref:Uncharacterized protein n=1 Tax=Eretmocerus hayati TaxID=131215 RepID=A0ACC2NVX1_9HYME|nr:hypothetical protein QAD02_010527 [Eretmocerus hayati]
MDLFTPAADYTVDHLCESNFLLLLDSSGFSCSLGDRTVVSSREGLRVVLAPGMSERIHLLSVMGYGKDTSEDASNGMEIGNEDTPSATPHRQLFVDPKIGGSRQRHNSSPSQRSSSSLHTKRKKVEPEAVQKSDINETVTNNYDIQDNLTELLNDKQVNSSKIPIQVIQITPRQDVRVCHVFGDGSSQDLDKRGNPGAECGNIQGCCRTTRTKDPKDSAHKGRKINKTTAQEACSLHKGPR